MPVAEDLNAESFWEAKGSNKAKCFVPAKIHRRRRYLELFGCQFKPLPAPFHASREKHLQVAFTKEPRRGEPVPFSSQYELLKLIIVALDIIWQASSLREGRQNPIVSYFINEFCDLLLAVQKNKRSQCHLRTVTRISKCSDLDDFPALC